MAVSAEDFYTNIRLMICQETKGFYEVASNRFVDYLCVSIHCELFLKCRDKLVPCLKQKLGVLETDGETQPPHFAM